MTKTEGTSGLAKNLAGLYLENEDLLRHIAQVISASETGSLPGLRIALHDLLAETAARFAEEERLMSECRYEAAETHRIEHERLLNELRQQLDELDSGKLTVAYIGRFTHNWVLHHIVTSDSDFVNAILTHSGTSERRQAPGEPSEDQAAVVAFEERRLENLEPIRWTANMEIGYRGIDSEHRSIITLLNAIIEANEAADRPRLSELLEQLGDETAAHFHNEEQLMASISHELFDEHRAEHCRLLDEYANQVDEFRRDKISAEFLCRFIYRWFVRHIEGLDATLKAA